MLAFLVLASVAAVVAAPVLIAGMGDATDDAEDVPVLEKDETGDGDLWDDAMRDAPSGEPEAGVDAEGIEEGEAPRAVRSPEDDAPSPGPAPETAVPDEAPGATAEDDTETHDRDVEDLMERVMAEAAGHGDPGSALPPEPGDAPDTPPTDVVDTPVLGPADPDAPDMPPDDAAQAPLLAPTPGDAPEDAPVAGAAALSATPPSGEDATGPESPLLVENFTVGRDVLQLTIETDLPEGDVSVRVAPSADGERGVVTANGVIVALLEDAPEAGIEDLEIQFAPVKPLVP